MPVTAQSTESASATDRPDGIVPLLVLPAALVVIGWMMVFLGLSGVESTAGVTSWAMPLMLGGCGLLTAAAAMLGVQAFKLGATLRWTRARFRVQATTDALTGALNHTAFMDTLERDFARSQRYGESLALMLLDIDFFKRINDGYGHAVGDHALKSFATALSDGLRTVDAIGRIGGARFAILLPNTTGEAALGLAERLRQRVAEIVVRTPAHEEVRFTASAGVAGLTTIDSSSDRFLQRADTALAAAKASGRNRVEAAAPAEGEAAA